MDNLKIISSTLLECTEKLTKKSDYGRFGDDDLFCALVENKEKQYRNLLSPVEPSSSQVYEFSGLGADSPEKPQLASNEAVESALQQCGSEANKGKRKGSRGRGSESAKKPRNTEARSPSSTVRTPTSGGSGSKRGARLLFDDESVTSNDPDSVQLVNAQLENEVPKTSPVPTKVKARVTPKKNGRTRASLGNNSRRGSVSLCSFDNTRVFFLSGFSEAQVITMVEKVEKLGAQVAFNVCDATHVVGCQVRRTTNFVCAVARRIPIVTEDWIENCLTKGVDDWKKYILFDPIGEDRAGVVLRNIYKMAPPSFLRDFQVYVTANVVPSKEQLDLVLSCVDAKLVDSVPAVRGNTLVVTSKKDYESNDVAVANRRGVQVIDATSLLSAICCNSASAYKVVPRKSA